MIRIVTDSTSYLPTEIVQDYGITVVPLKVQFGQATYAEGRGISTAEFYERLAATRDFPTTSQPSAGEFKAAYECIHQSDPGAQILVLTVSSKLSGTYHSAVTAAAQWPAGTITVFDSLSAAMGLGLMVLTAVRMTRSDWPLAAILSRLGQMRQETRVVLVVENLEYLKRGGRIGAASVLLGTLLDTKSILALIDGTLQPLALVRTKPRAISRLLDELERQLLIPNQPVEVGVMHAAAAADMETLAVQLKARFNITRLYTSELGPVIGAHVGPGTVGAGFCPEPLASAI